MEALPTVPDEQQIGVVVILGLFICGYCAFFFLGRSENIRKRLLDGLGPRAGAIHHITFQKLLLLWAVHLCVYEFMIRGLVLHIMLRFGMWTAVAVTTTLYAAIHIPRGPVETLGAIPLGAALCLLVLAAGTFWPAFFIHFSLSVGNTFGMILRRKPGVVFTTRRYDPDRSGAC